MLAGKKAAKWREGDLILSKVYIFYSTHNLKYCMSSLFFSKYFYIC